MIFSYKNIYYKSIVLAAVVKKKMDSDMHWINHYPLKPYPIAWDRAL